MLNYKAWLDPLLSPVLVFSFERLELIVIVSTAILNLKY